MNAFLLLICSLKQLSYFRRGKSEPRAYDKRRGLQPAGENGTLAKSSGYEME